jgi:predicted ATPase/class 3 adenylate cyclase
MDIVVWLRSLGLGKYETIFRENDIDETVLPSLTHENLKELGVPSFGHRVKLLDAIAALRNDGGGKAPSVDAANTSGASSAPAEDRAERRQVTVMFSDLVGSTALSARMDPEDLREVISAYQKCVAETVQRFGGFVAKYMGDGVLVYFGYPQAHEDDAERAVRAGLELGAAVGALKTHAPLQTRVGIATGLVVVGDLIGSGASQEQAIVGETPNLAARLQGFAEPNSVVIAESTRKLVGNLFELRDTGAQELKGISGTVRAWAAVRPSSMESRFDALHAGGVTELVGREEELELLLRRWLKAKTGEGQVVLLSGEPGIGKSRLTAALMERLVSEPHTGVRYFCSPQHTDSALHPIISQMERAAGFTHDDNTQTKLDKLDALMAKSLTPPQDAALLADTLSLPNDGRYPTLELVPQQRRQQTLEALAAQMEALSRSSPILMIFEDVHWIDPTSLEALGRIVDRLTTLSVLLIVTYRPEFEPPWIGRPYVTALTLNRLGEREITAMIDRVTGNKVLPESIRQDIIERTDGVPLFVEEMTKAVLEAESEGEAQRNTAAVPSPALAVPASLHASLMARLDRLGPAKEIAQIGAAIGREFSHLLLDAVVRKSPAELQSALDRLIEAGLLFRQGVPPHATYLFKHALIRDAAYGTLLRDPRRGLHARIADTIENQFAEIAENQPEVLARHCTEAGMLDKAARLWGQAGQRSLDRSALLEAVELLSRAVTQMASLPATPARCREEIRLQVALVTPLMQVKGHAAPETKAAAERAHLLIEEAEARSEPLEDPLLLFSVLYSFWVAAHGAFNGDMMRALAAQFLELAEKQGATIPLVVGHRIMGSSLALTGDIAEGRRHYDQAITLYDPAAPHSLETRFGQDLGIANLSYRSTPLWLLGYPQAARTDNENSVAKARKTGHATTLILALTYMSVNDVLARKDYADAAKATNDELITLSDEKGALFWRTHGELLRGALLAQAGDASEAVQAISSSLTTIRSTGTKMFLPCFLMLLSEAHADLGEFDAAQSCINEALTAIQSNKERWCEAEVNRVAGEVALKSPDLDAVKAEAYFDRALTVARQQQAKSWELRASMSLARLWRDEGKVSEARELLAPIYGWFTEGFDTRDLKEAKTLLEQLAA